MHLLLFDIDGTLIYPHTVEADCFITAVKKVTGITHVSNDLRSYLHVTDIGIAKECIAYHFNREATLAELDATESLFLKLYQKKIAQFHPTPISGVHDLFLRLSENKNLALGIATGSYLQSAILKLKHAKIDISYYSFASCNDSFERIQIMKHALEIAKAAHQVSRFESIIYVGDAPWDILAARTLQWDLIAVASHYTPEMLKECGAKFIIKDYTRKDFFSYVAQIQNS